MISTKVQLKKSLWGYKGDTSVPFLKITLVDPKMIPRIRDESSIIPLFASGGEQVG